MQILLKRLWRDDEGQDLVEYALLIVLISLVAAGTLKTLGTTISTVFQDAITTLNNGT